MLSDMEGTGFEVFDPRFSTCFVEYVSVELLWSGARRQESPGWVSAGRYLVFSDTPNNRLMRLDETDRSVLELRAQSDNCNGETADRQGRLVMCEHLTRQMTRTEQDSSIKVIADHFNSKKGSIRRMMWSRVRVTQAEPFRSFVFRIDVQFNSR